MALPKKKTDININPPKVGTEYLKYGLDRINELMLKTNPKHNYLPRTIKLRDIDAAALDFVKNKDMKLILDEKDVPVFLLTKERWGEFSKTWQYVDNDQNVLTPYITIRKVRKEQGTRMGKRYTVAQHKKFAYYDVPILDEGEVINLRFKVPQPVSVDVTYEIRLFAKMQEYVNIFDELILDTFSSRQAYCWIKGNPFPIILEEELREEDILDVKGDRMYVSVYNFKILSFYQNEKNFEIVKTSRLPKTDVIVKN